MTKTHPQPSRPIMRENRGPPAMPQTAKQAPVPPRNIGLVPTPAKEEETDDAQ